MSLQVAVHLAVLFPTLFRLVAIKFKSSLFMTQSDHAVTIPSCLFLPQPHLFLWQGTGPRQRPSRLSIDQDFNRLLSENLRTLQLPPRQQEIVCSPVLHFHDGLDGHGHLEYEWILKVGQLIPGLQTTGLGEARLAALKQFHKDWPGPSLKDAAQVVIFHCRSSNMQIWRPSKPLS